MFKTKINGAKIRAIGFGFFILFLGFLCYEVYKKPSDASYISLPQHIKLSGRVYSMAYALDYNLGANSDAPAKTFFPLAGVSINYVCNSMVANSWPPKYTKTTLETKTTGADGFVNFTQHGLASEIKTIFQNCKPSPGDQAGSTSAVVKNVNPTNYSMTGALVSAYKYTNQYTNVVTDPSWIGNVYPNGANPYIGMGFQHPKVWGKVQTTDSNGNLPLRPAVNQKVCLFYHQVTDFNNTKCANASLIAKTNNKGVYYFDKLSYGDFVRNATETYAGQPVYYIYATWADSDILIYQSSGNYSTTVFDELGRNFTIRPACACPNTFSNSDGKGASVPGNGWGTAVNEEPADDRPTSPNFLKVYNNDTVHGLGWYPLGAYTSAANFYSKGLIPQDIRFYVNSLWPNPQATYYKKIAVCNPNNGRVVAGVALETGPGARTGYSYGISGAIDASDPQIGANQKPYQGYNRDDDLFSRINLPKDENTRRSTQLKFGILKDQNIRPGTSLSCQ